MFHMTHNTIFAIFSSMPLIQIIPVYILPAIIAIMHFLNTGTIFAFLYLLYTDSPNVHECVICDTGMLCGY